MSTGRGLQAEWPPAKAVQERGIGGGRKGEGRGLENVLT